MSKKSRSITPEQQERLKAALTTGSRMGASDMRMINMDVYRARLGAQWPKYKAIINSYAHTAIESELGPDDFIVPTRNGCAIFFFEKDKDQIKAASERISARIDERLSGDEVFGDPPLTCAMKAVDCAELLMQLDGEPAAAAATGPDLAFEEREQEEQKYWHFYAPLWNARVERILGSIHVMGRTPTLLRTPDKDYYQPDAARATDDIRAFNAMLADVYKLSKAGQNAAVVFSLNFKTFCAAEHVEKYMHALKQTPSSLLKYLTPRFVRIPPGTPQSLLATKVQMLAPMFKNVVLHVPPIVDIGTFGFVPCSMLSTSWSEIERLAGRGATETRRRLATGFALAAHSLRVDALIEGVDSPGALEAVAAAGADFISGAAIRSPDYEPWQQTQLPLANIHARLRPVAAARATA